MTLRTCPVCGGDLVVKRVEKLLRGGMHTAIVEVEAEVCQRCGERLYTQETVRHFEQIRQKLERHDVDDLHAVGQSFVE